MAAITAANPIEHLYSLLHSGRPPAKACSIMDQVMEAAKTTFEINEGNFLKLNSYETLTTADLGNKKLVWGFTTDNRPFIAFQYAVITTDVTTGTVKATKESSILFQKEKDDGDIVMQPSHKSFYIGRVDDRVVGELEKLFSGETLIREAGRTTLSITLINEATVALPSRDLIPPKTLSMREAPIIQ